MKILIVVDMQNDFIDGSLGTPEAQAIIPKVKEKIEEYRKNNYPILFTRDTHYENYLETQEGKNLPIKHCIKETEGWKIKEDLDCLDCAHVNKESFGWDFWGITLDPFYTDIKDIEEIELVGVCTDICVVSNALILKSQFPETKITVDASCCAGTTVENHKAALKVMKSCQVNVINGKKEFDWEKFIKNQNIAVHCATEKEAENFCNQMDKRGLKWFSGRSYLEEINWNIYEENTVYYSEGTFGNINHAKNSNDKILIWSDYME